MPFWVVSSLRFSSLTIVNQGSSLTIVNEGSSLKIANEGLLLTIANEGTSLTIVNETASFIKTVLLQNDSFLKRHDFSIITPSFKDQSIDRRAKSESGIKTPPPHKTFYETFGNDNVHPVGCTIHIQLAFYLIFSTLRTKFKNTIYEILIFYYKSYMY